MVRKGEEEEAVRSRRSVIVTWMLWVMNVLLTLFVITLCRPDATPPKAPSLLVERRHVGPASAVMYEVARRRALVIFFFHKGRKEWLKKKEKKMVEADICWQNCGFNEATCAKPLDFFILYFCPIT